MLGYNFRLAAPRKIAIIYGLRFPSKVEIVTGNASRTLPFPNFRFKSRPIRGHADKVCLGCQRNAITEMKNFLSNFQTLNSKKGKRKNDKEVGAY